MKKLVVALAVFAVSAGAYAKGMAAAGQSEFYHQAPAGESEGTAGLGIVVSGTSESTPDDAKITGTTLMAGYERGLNDVWALGATLGYTQLKIDNNGTKTKITGMDNLLVNLRGKHEMGEGLRYGAQLSLALEKGKVETNGDQNSADGGIVIAPYIGYEWMKDNCMFGGKLSRDVRIQDEKTESGGATATTSGNEAMTLTGFYEHNMDEKWTLGGSLAYAMTSDSKPEVGPSTDNGTTMTLAVYAPIRSVGPGTLIPRLERAMRSADNSDQTTTLVGVNYRMQF